MIEGDKEAIKFDIKDQPLTQEMAVLFEVQREMIVYLTDYLKLKHPYRTRDEYAMYVIGVMGERYRRWYRSLCGKITDADFAREYMGNPEKIVEAVSRCSNVAKYMKGFADRFSKKLRRKLKQERQESLPVVRKKVAEKAAAVLGK